MISRPTIDQQVTFLYCEDLAATDAFYAVLLGLDLVLDQGPCRIYRVSGSAFLGFCRKTANLAPQRADGVILTLVVDEQTQVDQWYDYLMSAGASEMVEKPPALNPHFNIYHLFLRDSDGYLIEIQAFLNPSWPKHQFRSDI
jgi:catechol 2,3-dioxygenase-like lactoylglutathione lyase family enzyme